MLYLVHKKVNLKMNISLRFDNWKWWQTLDHWNNELWALIDRTIHEPQGFVEKNIWNFINLSLSRKLLAVGDCFPHFLWLLYLGGNFLFRCWVMDIYRVRQPEHNLGAEYLSGGNEQAHHQYSRAICSRFSIVWNVIISGNLKWHFSARKLTLDFSEMTSGLVGSFVCICKK